MPRQKPIPQRLKRLEKGDYIPIHDNNGDILVVTKQETKAVIKEMLEQHYQLLSQRSIQKLENNLTKLVESKTTQIETDAEAFINHKIDEIAYKICDMLITRKFKEEVEKRAEELLRLKQTKGGF